MVGLILRDTPRDGKRWCLIGGRLLLDETVSAAVDRQLETAVGDSLARVGDATFTPFLVEYRRSFVPGYPHDPRQHAVSATVPVWMSGEGAHRGPEAQGFKWWRLDDLNDQVMGFGQENLVPLLRRAVDSATA